MGRLSSKYLAAIYLSILAFLIKNQQATERVACLRCAAAHFLCRNSAVTPSYL